MNVSESLSSSIKQKTQTPKAIISIRHYKNLVLDHGVAVLSRISTKNNPNCKQSSTYATRSCHCQSVPPSTGKVLKGSNKFCLFCRFHPSVPSVSLFFVRHINGRTPLCNLDIYNPHENVEHSRS